MTAIDTVPVDISKVAQRIPLGATLILPAGDFPDITRLTQSPAVGDKLKAIELYGMLWGDCVAE